MDKEIKIMNYQVKNGNVNFRVPHGKYIFMTFETLSKLNFRKWDFNRKPSEEKISEICDVILENKRCEGIIYTAKLNKKYNCYDGFHRYNAIKRCLQKEPQLKYCNIILFVLDTTEDEDLNTARILGHFRELNKCDPVSEIYFENPDDKKRRVIESIKDFYHTKYKKFFVTSKNPRVPHENIERFVDRLGELYNEKKIESYEQFKQLLDGLNRKNGWHIHSLPESAKQKCVANNFFLFAIKNWHLQ
jgi:hypothetical protein